MQKWLLVYCLLFSIGIQAQNIHLPYASTQEDLPEWAQLMYAPEADLNAVQIAFEAYYKTHTFKKNKHTQYYKRWQRHFARYPNWQGMSKTEQTHYQEKQAEYRQKSLQLQQQRSPTSSWQSM